MSLQQAILSAFAEQHERFNPLNPAHRRALELRLEKMTRVGEVEHAASRDRVDAPHEPITCAICLEPTRHTTVLPCAHRFHRACIRRWAMSSQAPQCPLCRTVF